MLFSDVAKVITYNPDKFLYQSIAYCPQSEAMNAALSKNGPNGILRLFRYLPSNAITIITAVAKYAARDNPTIDFCQPSNRPSTKPSRTSPPPIHLPFDI